MGGRAIAKLINQEEADRITLDQKNEYLDFLNKFVLKHHTQLNPFSIFINVSYFNLNVLV